MSIKLSIPNTDSKDESSDEEELSYKVFLSHAQSLIKSEIRRVIHPKNQPSIAVVIAQNKKYDEAKKYVDSNYTISPSIYFYKEAALRSKTNKEMADFIVERQDYVNLLLLELDLIRIEHISMVKSDSTPSELVNKLIDISSAISAAKVMLGNEDSYDKYG